MKEYRLQSLKYRKWYQKLVGKNLSDGWIYKIMMYFLLIVIGFVFVYPLLYMLAVSLMSNVDLVDSSIRWIPSTLYFDNFKLAFRSLELPESLLISMFIAGISTLSVALASALIGYGLARFEFPGKKLVFGLMLFSYIMPKTLFFIPTYQIFTSLKLNGKLLALILPAISGQGLQGALFILIFYQFFKMIPKSIEEAAIIDGASSWKIFYKISLRMVTPAFIITFVYGFAIYWNETFLISTYLSGKFKTIPMLLRNLESQYNSQLGGMDPSMNPNLTFTEAKAFAGAILSIIPLMVFYIIVQRWFVESIDQTGIAGE